MVSIDLAPYKSKSEGRFDKDSSLPRFRSKPSSPSPSRSPSSPSSPPTMFYRSTYLFLVLVRLFFALQPSYLHPDENFQGPEVLGGQFFNWPQSLPWEFRPSHPIRSMLPIWMTYGLPLTMVKWTWQLLYTGTPPPQLVFTLLRINMFLISFLLEDWAVLELMPSQGTRHQALLLVASSYATWVFQTHTFSNAVETVGVLWALVMMKRIHSNQHHNSVISSAILGLIAVFGTFNRITFPFWLVGPGLQLLPHFLRNPWSLISAAASAFFALALNIYVDTKFYAAIADTSENPFGLTSLVLCPLNNIRYNSRVSNLKYHGIHPRWFHFGLNFFVLLGPAYVLVLASIVARVFPRIHLPQTFSLHNVRALSAFTGTLLLSIVPHQEARFLLPAVPLLLSCFRYKHSILRLFIVPWVIFNIILGVILGIYHQAGVFPVQASVPRLFYDISVPPSPGASLGTAKIIWWKAYTAPRWLLGDVHSPHLPLPYDKITMVRSLSKPYPKAFKALEAQVPQNATILPPLPDGAISDSNAPGKGVNGIRIAYRNPLILITPHANTITDAYAAPSPLPPSTISSSSSFSASKDVARPRKLIDSDLEFHLLMTHKHHIDYDDINIKTGGGLWAELKRVVGRKGMDVWLVTWNREHQQQQQQQ